MTELPPWLINVLKNPHESKMVLWIILVLLLFGVLSSAAKIFESIIKFIDLVVSGFHVLIERREGGRKRSEWIKRKGQFLKMLASDLSSIAKNEAWNDQHFTDLEADVEVDGWYYTSRFSKILRRKSRGLRRTPSLIKAIDQSSEKCLLLTGDPGAGKSVALRHLATQMIERSIKSKRENSVVPLYVNLREMTIDDGTPISPDRIKEFVIDNVRRGDADTAEYVKDNWEDFNNRGIWFFLFDSFDEIPSVMHASANDVAVETYSSAIRKFMDGRGDCRGVLASREYKSPGALPWPKLRILPLSEIKQEELIGRTFLEGQQKEIVLRHISKSTSATYKNPLFLSLLCRYVRQHSIAPMNEHELLYSHVTSLARRDDDYVKRMWDLTANDLLSGASELSKLFALSDKLGLAPAVSEIQEAANVMRLGISSERLVALIEALTYVKIGRTDVLGAEKSSRRFAFAHRRYQECFFALYLAEHRELLSNEELITDPRWRDYVVALLQIANNDVVTSIVKTAAELLTRYTASVRIESHKYFGISINSLRWDDKVLEHMLNLLLESKLYNANGPWALLVEPMEKLLSASWRKGDYYDRLKVMEFCGLGDPALILKRVEYSIISGVPQLQEEALNACRFFGKPSAPLAHWVRKQITSRMATSKKRFEMLRWEAVAMELPSGFEMAIPLERSRYIYRFSHVINMARLLDKATDRLLSLIAVRYGTAKRGRFSSEILFFNMNVLQLSIMCAAGGFALLFGPGGYMAKILGVVFICLFIRMISIFAKLSCLSFPGRLSVFAAIKFWVNSIRELPPIFSGLGVAFIALSAPGVIFFWGCRLFGIFVDLPEYSLITMGSLGSMLLVTPVVAYVSRVSHRKATGRCKELISRGIGFSKAIPLAQSGLEVYLLCFYASSEPRSVLRRLVAMLTASERLLRKHPSSKSLPWFADISASTMHSAIGVLISSIQEKDLAASKTGSG